MRKKTVTRKRAKKVTPETKATDMFTTDCRATVAIFKAQLDGWMARELRVAQNTLEDEIRKSIKLVAMDVVADEMRRVNIETLAMQSVNKIVESEVEKHIANMDTASLRRLASRACREFPLVQQ